MPKFVAVVLAVALLLLPRLSHAMQFTPMELAGNQVMIAARGPIVAGDFDHFRALVKSVPDTEHIAGVMLDSPGGLVVEAERMATAIHTLGLPVSVAAGRGCASACFLMFAAAPRRSAAPGTLVGVHRASLNGQETVESREITDHMAGFLRDDGVPSEIIARMEKTPANGVAWLTQDELDSMRVATYQPGHVTAATPDHHVVAMPGDDGAARLPVVVTPQGIGTPERPVAANFGLGQ